MRRSRTIVAASLTALALLAGCGDDGDSPPSSTTAASSTTVSPEAVRAALLTPADVPGSIVSTSTEADADFSACFPGNPLGGKDFPNEVESPDLDLAEGIVQRTYSSAARVATPDQAKDFVSTFSSGAGAQCVLDAFKTSISEARSTPKFDASNLTGKVSDVSVGEDAGLLTVTGNLTGGGQSIPIAVDLLAFRKGANVVILSAGAVQGGTVPDQAVELAKKVAGRLP